MPPHIMNNYPSTVAATTTRFHLPRPDCSGVKGTTHYRSPGLMLQTSSSRHGFANVSTGIIKDRSLPKWDIFLRPLESLQLSGLLWTMTLRSSLLLAPTCGEPGACFLGSFLCTDLLGVLRPKREKKIFASMPCTHAHTNTHTHTHTHTRTHARTRTHERTNE